MAVTKAIYESYSAEARQWLARSVIDDADGRSQGDAAAWLWQHRDSGDTSGRRVLAFEAGPTLVIWKFSSQGVDAVLASSSYLRERGTEAFRDGGVQWSLVDMDGRTLLGNVSASGPAIERAAATAGLPWTLRVAAAPMTIRPTSPQRQRLLLVLGLVLLVLVAGWYLVFRALGRERQVAQLQSNFVAAVSHEFRSPLTALAHAADLLAEDRVTSEPLRRETYSVLVRETARLRGLVEGLLDFDRFAHGSSAFRFEAVDVDALVADTVRVFGQHVAADGYRVELTGEPGGSLVLADREALARAIWNLLDNAVKYSPECQTIWVDLERHAERVCVTVRDRGIGIPPDEQGAIFDRFVRGTEPTSRRIRGTGLGLALVRQIAQAHGGEVVVASEPGQGSRFTLVLHTGEAA